MKPEPLWNRLQCAEFLDKTVNALDVMRCRGQGPRWIAMGRSIRYRPEDVYAWVDANARGGKPREVA